jgi:hypothetical protein
MRAHAAEYVARDDFAAVSPAVFEALVDSGLRAAGAVAVWVLQHSLDPERDIDLIARGLRPTGTLVVLNRTDRVVPARQGDAFGAWVDDGVDIHGLLRAKFRLKEWMTPPEHICDPVSRFTRWERL